MLTLFEAPLQTGLIVVSFHVNDSRDLNEIESRLMHLGFFEGERVKITKKAPFFREPLLIQVRGRLVALSKAEAKMVEVRVEA